MNIAVIGSGGREHALVRKFAESEQVDRILAIPGNAGMGDAAEVIHGVSEMDFEAISGVCLEQDVEWVFVGPEAPLCEGIVDYLEGEHGIKVFGPRKKEAQMESSKAFTKALMAKYDIPTAKFAKFTDYDEACQYIRQTGAPIVLKKDGLSGGKGVVVAGDMDEAFAGLDELMAGGAVGAPIVVEEYLEGEEFSLMVFVNGDYSHSFEMIAQDHKRAFDGDTGPNTGGMGAYAPVAHIGEVYRQEAVEKIVGPVTRAMVEEGLDYFGVLYLGAMVTEDGVKVIEFNARFGDPEAQILLSMMEDDLVDVIENTRDKEPCSLTFKPGCMVGVMLSSEGYPKAYEKGKYVDFDDITDHCYISGLTQDIEGRFMTSGGRVLLVTGYGDDIAAAVEDAYANVDKVRFDADTLFYRRDIGSRAL
ncbi:phosphoribosylamine--glycine ligase [Salinicoccus albus]|uniref:phosphoribosylamine--glycine ligase n=1 Tax=Salinicoccus albus TaxID=418756 RepID=UPI0003684A3A|nr:phosphoribosylamine--glycine ligase [Salinicoccus albus]